MEETFKDIVENTGKFAIVVKVSLIEWYEDDIGQYQEKGLPRSFDDPKTIICDAEDDDTIGATILRDLEVAYNVCPVLVAWDRIKE